MTAGKWSVTRYEGRLWRVWDGDGNYRGTYLTWEAAMWYADRDARTVTVVLPADPDRYAQYRGVVTSSDAPPQYHFGAGPGRGWSNMIYLEAAQITPFALALLAHARRMA